MRQTINERLKKIKKKMLLIQDTLLTYYHYQHCENYLHVYISYKHQKKFSRIDNVIVINKIINQTNGQITQTNHNGSVVDKEA